MTGPHPNGSFETSPARHGGAAWAGLSAGVQYRIVKPFRDASGARHRVGQTWTFLGFTLDGEDLQLWISRQGLREGAIPLVVSQRRDGEVAANLPRYVVEHDPPTVAEQMADLLSETLSAVESSGASRCSTDTTDELAATLRTHITSLRDGGTSASPTGLHALFLPTGALQGTSIDDGWGAVYIALAERYERLAPRLRAEHEALQRAGAVTQVRALRRRKTLRTVAAVAVVVTAVMSAAYVGGVLPFALGIAAVLGALALLVGFGLAWVFSGGLFSRHPIRDGFRKTVASPTALAIAIAFLVSDGLLLIWGILAVLQWFRS